MKIKNSKLKTSSGFTLLELIIVVAIVAILAAVLLVLLNPWQQIGKANDARRKEDLATLRKVLEDYYNDKGCYPLASQICYNTPLPNYKGLGGGATLISYSCNICGNEPLSPSFSPYVSKLPCDPQHPTKDYLYNIDPSSCPSWYKIYSDLYLASDNDAAALNCLAGGCGPPYPPTPTPPYGYDYGISNTTLDYSSQYNCISVTGLCNVCGTYSQCSVDPGCPNKSKIYATYQACCLNNPGACR